MLRASEGIKKDDQTSIIEDSKDESTNDSQSDESNTPENSEPEKLRLFGLIIALNL